MSEENNIKTGDTEETQVYELGYHMLPTIVTDDLEGEVAKVRLAIEKRGGVFISEGTTEMTPLAYPMVVNNGGKHTNYESAYFGWIKFAMIPKEASVLQNEDLKQNSSLLRFKLIKTTREETRAQLQSEKHTILREVHTDTTLKKREFTEEGGEVSEEELDKSIDELVDEGVDIEEVIVKTERVEVSDDANLDEKEADEETSEEKKEEEEKEEKTM